MKKQYLKKSKFQHKLFLFSRERADSLRKRGYFHSFGKTVLWQTYTYTSEPYLVCIGSNVKETTVVRFVTYDLRIIFFGYTAYSFNKECLYYMVKIIVGNNVMIEANLIIIAKLIIRDYVIITYESEISNDIPSRNVVGLYQQRLLENLMIMLKCINDGKINLYI